jgi:tRNA 2-thiouridine synthesizing protein A
MTQDHPLSVLAVIDARGLNCPLPVLRLRKRLMEIPAGGMIELLATDRAALRDVPAFCEAQGHGVVSVAEEAKGTLRFHVVKAPAVLPNI